MEITVEHVLWLIPIIAWELYWKGRALWKAVHANDKKWFWALLIVNSAGLLPIYYLNHHKKSEFKPADTNL